MANNEEIRAVSNEIWNAGIALTHNQLDELLAKLVETAERKRTEEVIEEMQYCDFKRYDTPTTVDRIRARFLPPKP